MTMKHNKRLYHLIIHEELCPSCMYQHYHCIAIAIAIAITIIIIIIIITIALVMNSIDNIKHFITIPQ